MARTRFWHSGHVFSLSPSVSHARQTRRRGKCTTAGPLLQRPWGFGCMQPVNVWQTAISFLVERDFKSRRRGRDESTTTEKGIVRRLTYYTAKARFLKEKLGTRALMSFLHDWLSNPGIEKHSNGETFSCTKPAFIQKRRALFDREQRP